LPATGDAANGEIVKRRSSHGTLAS
jgi:hypothetical protein